MDESSRSKYYKASRGDYERMMTTCEGQTAVLGAYRRMTEQEQAHIIHACTLIVRDRLVTDETVKRMVDGIKEAYKASYTVHMRNMNKLPQGESLKGMDRRGLDINSLR